MNLLFEKRENESPAAFAAFVVYRDLGPQRSLQKAYAKSSGKGPLTSGRWNVWSGENEWVQRASAYDQHRDSARLQLRLSHDDELERRRFLFEMQEQQRKEDTVAMMQAHLANVTVFHNPTMSQFAGLVKQVDATAALAINGVRLQSSNAVTPIVKEATFNETDIERLEALTDEELPVYIRLRNKTAEPESIAGIGAEPVADQE